MNPIEPLKVDLPLSTTAAPKTVASTCAAQSSVIKQAPGYATTPAVQAAVGDMDTAVTALQATVGKLDNLDAERSALITTRTAQVSTLRLKHDNVATALNTASNNDPQAVQAWVGKTKSRAKPTPVTTSTNPPDGAQLAIVKSSHGSVKASCTPEAGALSYLFQQGGDPAHPETWPAPFVARGHTFKVHNQPIGQPIYMRIAIVRRGSVQSQWTPVLQIVVR
jgi:hypothetical protein